MLSQPLIIIGMHRSGTSLLTRMLEKSGYFFGKRQEVNSESTFHIRLNDWLLAESGAAWDNPRPFVRLVGEHRGVVEERLIKLLGGVRSAEYLGRRFLNENLTSGLKGRWGWKDPRTTITLPLWLKLYPAAKVLHIVRNPFDVAASLEAREARLLSQYKELERRKSPFLISKVSKYVSPKLLAREEGVKLWEDYTAHALSYQEMLGDNWCQIRYEDLLADTDKCFIKLYKFLEIPHDEHPVVEKSHLEVTRSFAFLSDDEGIRLYEKMKDLSLVKMFGYDKLP